jgi:nucleotide-binding universal stress UspA family protein
MTMLAAEESTMLPIKRILVPVDWSPPSRRAFQFAAALAQKHDAEVAVLHVVPFATLMYGPASEGYLDHVREELRHLGQADCITRVRSLVAEGNPVTAILQAAGDTHCDLIVMGTHGRQGLKRWLGGSVAEEIVRQAPCPVWTVNARVPTEPTRP